jgi:hypothetical protein
MTDHAWTEQELSTVGRTDELGISSRRRDGTLRPFVTIWGVRVGDDVYVRSAYGTDNPWYVRARRSGTGRIRVGALERDVTFEDAGEAAHPAIDAAYHAKYDRYGPRIVGSVVGSHAAPGTLRVLPAD